MPPGSSRGQTQRLSPCEKPSYKQGLRIVEKCTLRAGFSSTAHALWAESSSADAQKVKRLFKEVNIAWTVGSLSAETVMPCCDWTLAYFPLPHFDSSWRLGTSVSSDEGQGQMLCNTRKARHRRQ